MKLITLVIVDSEQECGRIKVPDRFFNDESLRIGRGQAAKIAKMNLPNPHLEDEQGERTWFLNSYDFTTWYEAD